MEVNKKYIYHTYACGDEETCEFSIELFDFSLEEEPTGNPVKKITCFDELLSFIDETY